MPDIIRIARHERHTSKASETLELDIRLQSVQKALSCTRIKQCNISVRDLDDLDPSLGSVSHKTNNNFEN